VGLKYDRYKEVKTTMMEGNMK